MPNRICYTKPSITELEVAYTTDAAANGWGERCYEYIDRFEGAFRRHIGSDYAIATSSCTGAMHMGLSALGVGPGDEVILADTNWIATVAPVVHLGATPVFVDVLPDSWCIAPAQIVKHITPRTKAIVATHLYGNLCDMDALMAIGRRTGIAIIEDAAEAIGSVWRNRRAGAIGTFGCFSFHGTKTLTTGEGGMFVTNEKALYDRVLTLSNHGRATTQTKQFWPDAIGFKYKMSNVQAAIGCAQVERIDDLIRRKREILAAYKTRLEGIAGLAMNPDHPGTTNGAWMPTVVFHPSMHVTREDLMRAFSAADIDARVFFYPLSSLDMFESRPANTNAFSLPERGINLPSYHDITESEIDRVAATVIEVVSNSRHRDYAERLSA